MIDKFHYLKVGLALVLAFVGAKMLLSDVFKIPIAISLSVVLGLVGCAVAASLLFPRRRSRQRSDPHDFPHGTSLKR